MTKTGFEIGVPTDQGHHELYRKELRTSVREIHNSGIVHMDLYPSNIMWKLGQSRDDEIQIKFIDWDAIQIIGEPYSLKVKDRLKVTLLDSVDGRWDLEYIDVICRNIQELSRVPQTKGSLDEKFNEIYFQKHRIHRTPQETEMLQTETTKMNLLTNDMQHLDLQGSKSVVY